MTHQIVQDIHRVRIPLTPIPRPSSYKSSTLTTASSLKHVKPSIPFRYTNQRSHSSHTYDISVKYYRDAYANGSNHSFPTNTLQEGKKCILYRPKSVCAILNAPRCTRPSPEIINLLNEYEEASSICSLTYDSHSLSRGHSIPISCDSQMSNSFALEDVLIFP